MELGQFWPVVAGTRSVWGGTGWYMVVLGQYNSVLLSIGSVECLYASIYWEKWRFDLKIVSSLPQQVIDFMTIRQ